MNIWLGVFGMALLPLLGACGFHEANKQPDYTNFLKQREYGNTNTAQPFATTSQAGQSEGFVAENIKTAITRSENEFLVVSEPAFPQADGRNAISDEQNFGAVAARETIESDLERIKRNREAYVVVEVEKLPTRPGEIGPNIVDYALASKHPVGITLYKRWTLGYGSYEEKCATYFSSDLAQQDFLRTGGPAKDKLGLDPDGDGYACNWDPGLYHF